ncbi:MAG: Ig-like domain-containing protein, partial [Saprospiraceae bacterium]|nr:Ig-like domain-containing protein [Saprospiraceae bacterium]
MIINIPNNDFQYSWKKFLKINTDLVSILLLASQNYLLILLKHFSIALIFSLIFVTNGLFGQSLETIASGSFIIDMGVVPQTKNNALKPYGLVYELAKDHLVPVKWVIDINKPKDGVDFIYNNTEYKGGPFIVPAEYRTAAVNTVISSWQSQGVVGTTTSSEIVVPVVSTIDYFMIWTLDQQNGSIAQSYLKNAGIPSSAYNWLDPQALNCCNDIFAMPHADPVWNTHSNLYNWNQTCRGAIWAACHAVSALENSFNPSMPSEQMNFLSEKTGTASGGGSWSDNSLLLWYDHDDGTTPYDYAFPNHPVMQFMGTIDQATENGSEQVYLPHLKWRNTTSIAVWDPNQPDLTNPNQKAAIIAFGSAFGDQNRGKIMYEAGHSHSKSSSPSSIAAQRAFFNFSFWAAADNAIKVTTNIPSNTSVNVPINLTASATGGAGSYTFEWLSNCPGTFSNAFSANTTFTPSSPGSCLIQLRVIDDCGRTSFESKTITVNSNPQPPVANNDVATIAECGTAQIDVIANDNDPESGMLTVTFVGAGSNGTFVNNGTGTVTYTPIEGFTGTDVVTYTICDPTNLCDDATITVTVNAN